MTQAEQPTPWYKRAAKCVYLACEQSVADDLSAGITRLGDENSALRAENEGLRKDAELVPDLCALITRLCREAGTSHVSQLAMDYLKRKDLLHKPLRSPLSGPMNKEIFDAAMQEGKK